MGGGGDGGGGFLGGGGGGRFRGRQIGFPFGWSSHLPLMQARGSEHIYSV
ncbi:hypothetical protein QJS10_CPB18g01664 [Acorus calamus]|uniref:Uncharacterized protein n=1 Tax=Acorus calamus TaxID=4465 RepID=A0AAV9CKD7_ACOCL|nr:hypothetical protein QJS10_CPB18g01664 [Acorus calamus]